LDRGLKKLSLPYFNLLGGPNFRKNRNIWGGFQTLKVWVGEKGREKRKVRRDFGLRKAILRFWEEGQKNFSLGFTFRI